MIRLHPTSISLTKDDVQSHLQSIVSRQNRSDLADAFNGLHLDGENRDFHDQDSGAATVNRNVRNQRGSVPDSSAHGLDKEATPRGNNGTSTTTNSTLQYSAPFGDSVGNYSVDSESRDGYGNWPATLTAACPAHRSATKAATAGRHLISYNSMQYMEFISRPRERQNSTEPGSDELMYRVKIPHPLLRLLNELSCIPLYKTPASKRQLPAGTDPSSIKRRRSGKFPVHSFRSHFSGPIVF